MNIVLIGFMGTGKSAVGRALARRMNARLLDTDAEIEREAGCTIPELFARDGEAAFREAETEVLQRLEAHGSPLVIATGGGTPLRTENAALLQQIGTLVWLLAPPETVLARVGRALEDRPLLAGDTKNPLARIQALMAERAPRYRALAEFQIDTSRYARPDAAAEHILHLLSEKNA